MRFEPITGNALVAESVSARNIFDELPPVQLSNHWDFGTLASQKYIAAKVGTDNSQTYNGLIIERPKSDSASYITPNQNAAWCQRSVVFLLYSRGDDADGLYCVCKGAVRISGISGDGSTWFGEVSLLDGLPRVHDADWAKQGITTGTNRQRTCWQF